ncbi:MAG: hypothetical protein ABR535_00665 [Pyrinomonadaceae bacterium]
MRKILFNLIGLAVLVAVGLGCGWVDRVRQAATEETNSSANSGNKTITQPAVETAVGETKIGIPECDEALNHLVDRANNPDDNFIVRAAKKTAATQFRDQVKKMIEDKGTDKKEAAKYCRDFRDSLSDNVAGNTANKN